MMRETAKGLIYLASFFVVLLILVYLAESNVSATFTKLLAPGSQGGVTYGTIAGVQIGFLTLAYDGPMIVFALALGYLAFKVRRREYRVLFIMLIIFAVLHIAYHGVVAIGNQTQNAFLTRTGRDLILPVDIWILAAFGIVYLRRELRAGG